MRLFIAVDVEKPIKSNLEEVQKQIKHENMRLVRPEHMHITLAFIGDKKISCRFDKIHFKPFEIKVRSLGVFPSINFAKILWAGIESNELYELSQKIRDELDIQEQFHSHITIARINGKIPDIVRTIEKYKIIAFGHQMVNNFVLKNSVLTPEGPVYEDMNRFSSQ